MGVSMHAFACVRVLFCARVHVTRVRVGLYIDENGVSSISMTQYYGSMGCLGGHTYCSAVQGNAQWRTTRKI